MKKLIALLLVVSSASIFAHCGCGCGSNSSCGNCCKEETVVQEAPVAPEATVVTDDKCNCGHPKPVAKADEKCPCNHPKPTTTK